MKRFITQIGLFSGIVCLTYATWRLPEINANHSWKLVLLVVTGVLLARTFRMLEDSIVSTLRNRAVRKPEKHNFLAAFRYFCPRPCVARSRKGHKVLGAFRGICSLSSRDIVDFTIHDLDLDMKEMRAEGRSERFIKFIVFWRSLSLVVTMTWSAVLEPVVKVVQGLRVK